MRDMRRRPHFLVGFDPYLCSQRLNIPCNFVKHMEGRTSGTALVVGPSGNNWFVGLILVEDSVFFSDGWADFVRDHLLEQGDSMVFRYDGDLCFTVQVFDRSMCEKEAAFTAESSQDLSNYDSNMLQKRDRERSALLDCIMEGVPKRMRCSQLHPERMCKDQECGSDVVSVEELSQLADGSNNLNNAVTVALPLRAVPPDDSDTSVWNRTSKLEMLLSASEAERIARSFASSFPNFIKVMKQFNISGSYTLNIPYKFATEHLPSCKLKIVLRNLKGVGWTVNSIPTTRVQTSHTFCGGWLSFVRDNNIGIGDVCIFELICKFELRVRILRVRKEGIDNDDGGGSSGGKNSKMSRRKSKKTNESAHNIKGSTICPQMKNGLEELDMHNRLGFIDKQASHTKGCMSLKSVPEEKMAAQYFISSFPYFVRVMKNFNISGSYTLKVPYRFSMEHLPNCRTEIVLHNLNGQSWTVNSIPTMKVQTLHTLCGGWMSFVRDNDIQMGDICIFELIGNCEMRVHVCGIGKKGLSYHKDLSEP